MLQLNQSSTMLWKPSSKHASKGMF